MKKQEALPIIHQMMKDSPFNKSFYRVDASFIVLAESLAQYGQDLLTDDLTKDTVSAPEIVRLMTPDFQRENNKWSLSMKKKFVENILMGAKSEILLYTLESDYRKRSYAKCFILDGLQRLTALSEFYNEEFTIFDDICPVYCSDLIETRAINYSSSTIAIRIYRFLKTEDAISFYINMNENITHSPEDIEKARKLLEG